MLLIGVFLLLLLYTTINNRYLEGSDLLATESLSSFLKSKPQTLSPAPAISTTGSQDNEETKSTTSPLITSWETAATETTSSFSASCRPFTADIGQRVLHLSGKFGYNNSFAKEMQAKKMFYIHNDKEELEFLSELPSFILDDPRFSRHIRFLTDPTDDTKRGGGYWFWKPILLQHYLEQELQPNDWLIWSDADHNDPFVLAPLIQYMTMTKKTMAVMYIEGFVNREWTKRDVYEAYCGEKQPSSGGTFWASYLVFRNTPGIRALIRQWANAMVDYHAISDEPSKIQPELMSFREHRHDQSLLSLILQCQQQGELTFETYPGEHCHKLILVMNFPFQLYEI